MPVYYEDTNALCPFYVCVGGKKIICEGAMNDMHIEMVFSRTKDREEYYEHTCCDNYKLCPYYKTIMNEKYGQS